jgi:hypothetical protein
VADELTRGGHPEPRTVVERAADAALRAVEESLEAEGAKALKVFVAVYADDVPADELECTTAGAGYDDARDLIAELLGHASAAAKQIGFTLHVVPEIVEPRHG